MIYMSQYKGKLLLSFLRESEYAHAGEEEAILKVMSKFPKSDDSQILDVGCGLGGTASFLQNNGWGKVTGADIDQQAVDHAKAKYPDVGFVQCDVHNIHQRLIGRKFDIICLFNSFYSFANQEKALESLSKVANEACRLAIFDYTDLCQGQKNPLHRAGNAEVNPFIPLKLQSFDTILKNSNWQLKQVVDLSDDYRRWYRKLLSKIQTNKKIIIRDFGMQALERAIITYQSIYQALEAKQLGGAVIYAEKTRVD